jgi:hypothetical protein
MHIQYLGNPLEAQYPSGSTNQTEHGIPQFPCQPPQTPFFTPVSSLGNPLDTQYTFSSTDQPGPEIPQFQYQQPQVQFW